MPSEVLARLLLDQAPDAVIFAGLDGVIQEWNAAAERVFGHAAAERVFGHAAAEAVGQSLDLIVPERFREAHWRGFDEALAAGDTKYRGQALPTRSMRKDGTDIYVELTFTIVEDGEGSVIGALAHARDITERFIREREQRQRIKALEERLGESA